MRMHELAVTQSVVDTVVERTRRAAGRSRSGSGSGACPGSCPEALRFCFDLVTEGTPLEGATLDIEEPEGSARAGGAASTFGLPDLILLCPCGSADVDVLTGRELAIGSVEVA